MKKLITKYVVIALIFLGAISGLQAQCTFTGLASPYCRNAAPVTLVPSVSNGTFSGPGITGSVFNPSLTAGGTQTITLNCPGNYSVTQGTYNMINTSGTTALTGFTSYDDVISSSSLAIGFPFKFFCNTYDGFYLCSNGWITFTQTNLTTYPGQQIPTNTTPSNMIAVVWVDLNLNSGGTIQYATIGTTPNRTCVVTWSNVPHYSGGNPVTVQLQLYETSNFIEIHSATNSGNGTSHTQGIQNANSSIGFTIPNRNANSTWTPANDCYRFTPNASCVNTQTTFVDPTNLAITGPSTLCLHSSAVLTASGTATYTWNTAQTTAAISVTPNSTSVYSVTGAANNQSGCVYTTSHTVTVYSTPVAAASNPNLLCVGNSATLTGSGAATYTWSTSDQTNTTVVNPVVSTTYTLWGTSAIGCEEMTTITQNVNTNVLGITQNTAVCLGTPATLTVTGGSTYSWSTVPPSPFTLITVTPNATSNYSVAAIDQFGCYLEAFVTVSVNPIPNITLTTPKQTVCKGEAVVFTAGGGSSYHWSQGTSTGSTITIIPTVDLPLTVSVTGTNQYGCTNKNQITINVSRCTGVNEIAADALLFGLYPNPAAGIFNLKKNSTTVSRAELFDSIGAHIATIDLNDDITVIDLTGHAAGVYFVKVTDKNGSSQLTKIINQ